MARFVKPSDWLGLCKCWRSTYLTTTPEQVTMFCPACGAPLTTRTDSQHNATAYCAAGDWELPPAVISLLKRRYDLSQVNDVSLVAIVVAVGLVGGRV